MGNIVWIKDFQSEDRRRFALVSFDDYFCAIEDKYIDANGNITVPLCGAALHAAESPETCIKYTNLSCRVDALVKKGYDSIVATIMVVGDVDEDEARIMLANIHPFNLDIMT